MIQRHMHSGKRLIGFVFAFITAVLYATIPIGLKQLVQWLPITTLTWFRFVIAFVIICPYVVIRHGWRGIFSARQIPLLSLICVAGLVGNNLIYQAGIKTITPDTAQVVMQLGPIGIIVGGVIFFRERFSPIQWIGLVVSMAGLVLFFNMRFTDLVHDVGNYGAGVALLSISALCYAVFALAQKQMLASMASEQILITMYLVGGIFMTPFGSVSDLALLNTAQTALLLLVSVMTLVAYWTYTLTLKHIEASRSSVAIATSPIITIAIVSVLASTFPEVFESERINWLSIVGVFFVVAGLASHALVTKKPA